MIASTVLSERGIRAEFFQRLDATPALWTEIATKMTSNKEVERYGFLGSVPPLRQFGTGRIARALVDEKYDVANLVYEATIEFARTTLADDDLGQLKIRIGEMAERAKQFPDSEIARLLVNGTASPYNAYDGRPFFAPDHESGKSGAQSNVITPSATDANAPTTAEAKAAIGSAIAKLLSLVDSQGEPMNQSATGLILLCPPATYLTHLEALSAQVIAQTSNVLAGAAKVVAFPRLTAASKFYLLKQDVSVRPLILQEREAIELKTLMEDSETGFLRDVMMAGVRWRMRCTFGYWQRAVQATYTAA